ncbi:unnamed protein product [Dimorphilus gyrociliatus]|uniref:Sphingomyelin synthase-like domain-containing protein n=1 Tax=Dimorphilus gyrociliatus TaxID=2664684 RepID=A0A7I8W9G4_9ANNE|nr:unnamed protein product [Dimorphilus gyrociliatus]
MGMSIQGVTTCGDYIYSGHTVNMVAVTLTLIEYSPQTFTLLHWIFRLLCLAAMILLLIAHEHYTVDVILALYITSQMFTNYHMLAENPSIRNSQLAHRKLANLWYPLVRFFEENIQGPVPNEYEWPFGSPDSTGTRHLSFNVGCVARLWCAMNAEICRRLGSKGGRPSIT